MTHLIKVYHSSNIWKNSFRDFLDDIGKTMDNRVVTLWLHRIKWEIFYSLDASKVWYPIFESQFYTHFNDFQITPDKDEKVWSYSSKHSVAWEVWLENSWFYPFKMEEEDNSDFVFNLFRTFENFDVINDKVSLFIQLKPLAESSAYFSIKSRLQYKIFKQKLWIQFYKYMFNNKAKWNWKAEWDKYFADKIKWDLFETKIFIVAQSTNKQLAEWKIKSLFNNFLVFRNYPLNQFKLKIHKQINIKNIRKFNYSPFKKNIFNSHELSSIFHFPQNPQTEGSLLTVKSKKLPLPVWIPTFDYHRNEKNEVLAKAFPEDINIIWISDYRSITVPVWIHDEDRLKHMYIVGKTWTWKSKFMQWLMVNDIKQGRWIGVIDPHGDAIEEIMMHIPESRKNDVIIFDPTDDKFPFCLNPLDVWEDESKQVLAKWFIDIFHKFFGANWNPKLEHVLRMIFLALLDKKDATLFDIIRALTDKDFRYDMIDQIEDDVVRNFWTNEFAWRSQQFNTEAIMPILNKVWQLLSIEILKNIFASSENKLDFRKTMDEWKILLIKLPKWALQEEIMWFLWAMFVTKLFQAAMWRQNIGKSERKPFYLYVDEFQNFATDTFNEILSEARKYGLSLCVAHQFVKQIPTNISDSLFWNVWTMISFRVSSDDAEFVKTHYAPFLSWYDLANLNMREFYCKLLVKGEVKDPFSLRSMYMPDAEINKDYVKHLYELSRAKYSRTLEEAKKVVEKETKDVQRAIEEFAEPII